MDDVVLQPQVREALNDFGFRFPPNKIVDFTQFGQNARFDGIDVCGNGWLMCCAGSNLRRSRPSSGSNWTATTLTRTMCGLDITHLVFAASFSCLHSITMLTVPLTGGTIVGAGVVFPEGECSAGILPHPVHVQVRVVVIVMQSTSFMLFRFSGRPAIVVSRTRSYSSILCTTLLASRMSWFVTVFTYDE